MKGLLTALLLTACSLGIQGQDMEELYRQIDDAIEHSAEYVAQYEQLTSSLHSEYEQASDPDRKYELAMQLFGRYKSFCNDSALTFLEQARQLAVRKGRPDQAGNCKALMAFQCSTVGLYTEALSILKEIRKADLDTLGLTNYYKAWMHVNGELGYYTQIDSLRREYYDAETLYRDSLYSVIGQHSQDYLMFRVSQLLAQQRWAEAIDVSDEWMRGLKPEQRDYAIASYYRHLIFITQQKRQEAQYWLAQSALCDIRNAVMDQASLLALAEQLNADGDFDRSYHYIRFTWDCNNRFNTRMRSWQISPILTVIESNYQNELHQNARVLTWATVLVSILALLLLGVLFFLHRRNKQLAVAEGKLKEANQQLTDTNGQLALQADELSTLNSQLSTLNSQLSEANRVKEEYIGRFMSLCSQYIDKLDNYRKMVNRKMKNREMDELFQISKSTELKEKELEELYENFDSVFLHLFPGFVDDLNALLQPEYQIHPKEEDRLTTDLRIFALIRLGIEDSSKIAEFLHYSVNTIYNYRARIKNGALGQREQFEQQVKGLGAFVKG